MKIGDVIADKYLVERVLGKGGMAIVYLAKHLQLGERVAIKLLKTRTLKNADLVARFLREGRTAARLRSEYVARVHDVGTLPGGAPYLVMEYLDGRDFEAVLAEHGALEPKAAVKYLLQACEALAEAHAMGIVHRDLKPANLILIRKRDGTTAIKIIDFGISKLVASEAVGPEMTQASVMMGSPRYMAPEQMTSARDADARSDVFSLGAMLYHLLTGKPPFEGKTVVDVFERVSQGPPSPHALRPELPAGIEAVTSRCLRKSPDERYADVAELAAALAPFGPPHAELFAEAAERILLASTDTNAASSPVAPSGMTSPSPVSLRVPRPPEPVLELADPAPGTTSKKSPPAPPRAERAGPAEPRNLLDELFEMEKEKENPRPRDAAASEPAPRSRPLSRAPLSTPPPSGPARGTPPPASHPVVAPALEGPLDSLPPPPALPVGSPLGKADRAAAEAVLEAVREALSGFGLAGTVALEGSMLTLRGNGLPTSIDAGPAAEQWLLLPPDMQRRKALDLARRLAEAHRTAQRARSGGGGGGESSLPWGLAGKALLGLAAAAALVVGGRAYLASRKEALPQPVPVETPEQQSRRLATACRAVRERVYSGATIGPFDTTGWVVELWLASRPAPLADASKARVDAGAPASKAISAASMDGVVVTGHLAPGLDDALGRLPEGTLALDEAAIPATSPGWTGVTLRFGGGYSRAFFEPEPRARFLALSDRLFESSGADLGALYARCADSPVHDVGAWFRGRDPGAAATALLYGMGLFAERPQLDRAALGPAELDGLRARATAAKLDAPTLKGLVGEQGGSLAVSPGAVTLAFPLGGPVRAVRASRAVAVKLVIGRE